MKPGRGEASDLALPRRDARSPDVDLARLLLMVLVVLGHLFEQYWWGAFEASYRFLYLFHIPAFAFLSGMVARDRVGPADAERLVFGVLLVYLVHQGLMALLDSSLSGRPFVLALHLPNWVLWYLLSLACWRLLLPLLVVLRWPLAWACLLALLAGAVPYVEYPWSLSRTLVFLPFFVAGHLWSNRRGCQLPKLNAGLAVLLLGAVAVAAHFTADFSRKWYYGTVGYAQLHQDFWQGASYRGFYLVVAAAGVIGFLGLCARLPAPAWLAGLGRYSIAPYILHAYVLKLAIASGWLAGMPWLTDAWRYAGCVLAAVLLVVLGCLVGKWIPWLFDFSWLRGSLGSRAHPSQ